MTQPVISVVVCTYNRAELACLAVNSLCCQTLSPDSYEIIVVDNGSTDGTEATIADLQAVYVGHTVRYICEKRQGLSHARNRGYQEATGSYVAYLDDDGRAPNHWLHSACTLIREQQPAALGGPIVPFYLAEKPAWFRDAYGAVQKTDSARPLRAGEFLNGGNMIWRKDLLVALGGFDTAFGMRGTSIGYGEETEFQLRLRVRDPQALLYYDPDLFAYHLVRPEKWAWPWLVRARFADGRQHYHAAPNAHFRQSARLSTIVKVAVRCVLVGWELSFGALLRNRVKYPYAQNFWYEQTLRHVTALGAYAEHLASTRHG